MKVAASAPGRLDDIRSGIARIEERLQELDRRLLALEGAWDGDAQQAFARARREWQASMDRLTALAGAAGTRARRHVDDVKDFDTRRAGAWRI